MHVVGQWEEPERLKPLSLSLSQAFYPLRASSGDEAHSGVRSAAAAGEAETLTVSALCQVLPSAGLNWYFDHYVPQLEAGKSFKNMQSRQKQFL